MTLRILWASDKIRGGSSAYSKVSAEFCTRLVKMGHAVGHIPMGMSNDMGYQNMEGVLIHPSGDTRFGEDVMVEHYVDFRADLLVVLKDPWVLNEIYNKAVNFVPYCDLDHTPVSPWMLARLHNSFRTIVPSRFAQRELRGEGIENVVYIPHGVRTDLLRPLDDEARVLCRKMWFIPEDHFVGLVIARNQVRKMVPWMMRCCRYFKARNPDVKFRIFLFGDVEGAVIMDEGAVSLGVGDSGIYLLPEMIELGLHQDFMWPDKKLIRRGLIDWVGDNFVNGYDLCKLYNAADFVLNTTGGEGASLTVLEGSSCGVPGITTDYAAAPEYVGPGFAVPARILEDGLPDYVIVNTPGTRYHRADLVKTVEAMERILKGDRAKMARRCREFAMRYDYDRIMEEHWKPALIEWEEELRPLVTSEGVRAW